jgi:hypothetical protein
LTTRELTGAFSAGADRFVAAELRPGAAFFAGAALVAFFAADVADVAGAVTFLVAEAVLVAGRGVAAFAAPVPERPAAEAASLAAGAAATLAGVSFTDVRPETDFLVLRAMAGLLEGLGGCGGPQNVRRG